MVSGDDMDIYPRITVDSAQCAGKPCIRGHRLTVEHVLAVLAEGATFEDLKAEWEFLEPEDISAALRFAAWLAGERVVAAAS